MARERQGRPQRRARAEAMEVDPAPLQDQQAAEEQAAAGAVEPAQLNDRRAAWAQQARRRAAHFAHFNEEGQEEQGQDAAANVHAGGNEARTLGPWSSAVELVNARERAAEQRRAKLQHDTPGAGGQAAPSAGAQAAWVPTRDPALGPRMPCPVPSLRSLCVRLLVEYIECVESLYGVPDIIRTQLAAAVCERRRLDSQAAELFAADAPSELVLPDCTQLDKEALSRVLSLAITPKLERLELGMCGRGFGDNVLKLKQSAGAAAPAEEGAEALVRAARCCPGGTLPQLVHLRLGGAYRLNDEGLLQVLRVMPQLTHLAIPDASRLTPAILPHLPQLLPHLRHLDLAGCRGMDAEGLSHFLPRFAHLTCLVLDGIPEVGDSVLAALATGCKQLTQLSIAMCSAVSDSGVIALAAGLPRLELLKCDKCEKVTDKALQALAANCPGIKCLSVMRLRVSDAGLAPLIQRGCLAALALHGEPRVTDATLQQLAAHCHATLTHLDVSFCRSITSTGLGALVDRCTRLTSLLCFGCSQLTNTFAHGYTNEALLEAGGPQGLGTAVTMMAAAS